MTDSNVSMKPFVMGSSCTMAVGFQLVSFCSCRFIQVNKIKTLGLFCVWERSATRRFLLVKVTCYWKIV